MNSLAKRCIEAGKVVIALTHFNTRSVAAMPVPLPPLNEQLRIVAEVERRLSAIEELESAVQANLAPRPSASIDPSTSVLGQAIVCQSK